MAIPWLVKKLRERRLWAECRILSDPPGAYVYSLDGTYWGQADPYVSRLFWLDLTGPESHPYTILVRRGGFKDKTQTFQLRYTWDSKEEARTNAEEVMVVLQPLGAD